MSMIYKASEQQIPTPEPGDVIEHDVWHEGRVVGTARFTVEAIDDPEAGGGGSFCALTDTDGVSRLIGYFDSSVVIRRAR